MPMIKLTENLVRDISARRNEPEWLLAWRLSAFNSWRNMKEPHWAEIDYDPIDYDSLSYYKESKPVDNSDLREVYEKMGLPEAEQNALLGMATDTVIDSESVHTSYTAELERLGIIFMPLAQALQKYPDMVKKYLGTVVPPDDNFFACLNAAVFSDGTFVYVPPNTKCPIDLASYFRIETAHIGQFERTLIIADSGSELSYLEGCSAPRRPNHQLHSGVVEVIAMNDATVKYATVQNWYAGEFIERIAKSEDVNSYKLKDKNNSEILPNNLTPLCALPGRAHEAPGPVRERQRSEWVGRQRSARVGLRSDNLFQHGGILNFVTKRGRCDANAKLYWTQVEIGSAMTWKYPSTILAGDNSQSDFYSLSITRGAQQADTGTKMIHIGNNSVSNIVSYGVGLENSVQTFRSLVSFSDKTVGAINASKCDSRFVGCDATLNTLPKFVAGGGKNNYSHEASTGSIPADALYYLAGAGIREDEAAALIIAGLAMPIISRLPMEFLVESKQLIQMALADK